MLVKAWWRLLNKSDTCNKTYYSYHSYRPVISLIRNRQPTMLPSNLAIIIADGISAQSPLRTCVTLTLGVDPLRSVIVSFFVRSSPAEDEIVVPETSVPTRIQMSPRLASGSVRVEASANEIDDGELWGAIAGELSGAVAGEL